MNSKKNIIAVNITKKRKGISEHAIKWIPSENNVRLVLK